MNQSKNGFFYIHVVSSQCWRRRETCNWSSSWWGETPIWLWWSSSWWCISNGHTIAMGEQCDIWYAICWWNSSYCTRFVHNQGWIDHRHTCICTLAVVGKRQHYMYKNDARIIIVTKTNNYNRLLVFRHEEVIEPSGIMLNSTSYMYVAQT